METLGTILIVSEAAKNWAAIAAMLSDDQEYRVLGARSHVDATSALAHAHVDLVIAEDDDGSGRALRFLADLRVSHADVVRVLVLPTDMELTESALAPAAVYQLLRQPLDSVQVGLVAKRGLEARELARRHRLLSREFKVPAGSLSHRELHGLAARSDNQRFEKLVFVSEKMAELCDMARKAAQTELPILIQGETGTARSCWRVPSTTIRPAGPVR